MPAWTFHKPNRELRFVVKFFKKNSKTVVKVSWLEGIKRGAQISPGIDLAMLSWDDGSKKVLKAAPGCKGIIAALNRRIVYEKLDKHPSEWALWLSDSSTTAT